MAKGYYRMLGHLDEQGINWLSEMVLERCRWFPTVAECRDLIAEPNYANRFYVARRAAEHAKLGYVKRLPQENNAGYIDTPGE